MEIAAAVLLSFAIAAAILVGAAKDFKQKIFFGIGSLVLTIASIILFSKHMASLTDNTWLRTPECPASYNRLWRSLTVKSLYMSPAQEDALRLAMRNWNDKVGLEVFVPFETGVPDVQVSLGSAKSTTTFDMTSCQDVKRINIYLFGGERPSKWVGVLMHELGHALFLAHDGFADSIMYTKAGEPYFGDITTEDAKRVAGRFRSTP